MDNFNILVTGTRRSGTTFLGRMLSLDKSVSYINEPFNYDQGIRGINKYWYQYITKRNINQNQKDILDNFFNLKTVNSKVSIGKMNTKEFRYDVNKIELMKNLFFNYSKENLIKRFSRIFIKNRFYLTYLQAKLNPFRKRILIKDPIAALSSNYLSNEYKLMVVVIVRHPAAYYCSMKRRRWGISPKNFLEQVDLMRDYLMDFKNDLESANTLEEKILLEYLCINKVLYDYIKNNKRFILVKHEDLCLDPVNAIKNLYKKLNLEYSQEIERKIISHTTDKNVIISKDISNIKRDSYHLAFNWKLELSNQEIEKIKYKTYFLSKKYYSKSSWD